MIKGVTVTIIQRVKTGTDAFNAPIYNTVTDTVSNVLYSPTDPADNISELQLYGKQSVYTLAIPKGDTHNWKDAIVEIPLVTGSERFRVFGEPISGIEANIPLGWNTKVKVERYE